ncbi:MAG TPA: hypothetical protein ENL03_01470, partial [Phycisphaerae bacterium]|nr:hypothetical protein [Phycisphaerae bacterium]
MNTFDGQHPDFGELDAFRTGEADESTSLHIQSCERCRGIVESLSMTAEMLSSPVGDIPDRADLAVMSIIRERAAAAERPRSRVLVYIRRGAVAAAAMVVLGLGVWLYPGLDKSSENPSAGPAAITAIHEADIDGDGRVDVVDAYLLARKVKSGS